MKMVAISGCTGAIGIALINKCIEKGIKVIAYVRPGSKRRDRIPKSDLVKISDYDMADFAKLSRLSSMVKLPQVDVFYHLAWAGTIGEERNDARLQSLNIQYTLDAVELAAAMGAKVFVGAGSQAEYGRVEGILKPDTPVNPENGYGQAKLCAGQLSRLMCEQYGMKHIWARVLSVYGPYDGEKTMIISTIKKLITGERPPLTAGKQEWDYLYSGDGAEAFYLMGEKSYLTPYSGKGENSKVYCLGSGQAYPLRSYIKILRDTINPDLSLGFGEIPYSDKQVMYLCADISALRNDTGFVPKTSFEKGIKETIAYVRSMR
ncbi:MAG: NAD(P)-dependent oxidoreductase [Lachnospiraceae bacterium]|nr:NAD(P)-dependent oxidoreductase [Lachnospiraceae bacterium]